ncbi:hypothetical protein JCM5350_006152 [Sporobolomyces pararoseus]
MSAQRSTVSSPSPSTTTTKRVQVRPWLPPPSANDPEMSNTSNRRSATSLTLDTSTSSTPPLSASSTATTRSPSPARTPSTSPPLKLQVLDVTCSAVALSVFTRNSTNSTTKPPSISILLDRRPWPHVAHAGSAPAELGLETTVIVYGLDPNREYEIGFEVSSEPTASQAASTVGGVGGDSQSYEAGVHSAGTQDDSDMLGEGSTSSRRPSLESALGDSTTEDQNLNNPDGPPPPYSPSPVIIPPTSTPIPPVSVPITQTASTHVTTSSSTASPSSRSSSSHHHHHPHHARSSSTDHLQTTGSGGGASDGEDSSDPMLSDLTQFSSESQLRNALKTLRSNSKRTEQSLLATLSSLRKTVEKTAKEDQRARSRIVALEEAIRKAEKVEIEVRGKEKDEIEERLKMVEREEEKVRKVLEDWKEGGGKRPESISAAIGAVEERRNSTDDSKPANTSGNDSNSTTTGGGGGGTSNLAELAKELDALNKAIEAVEREKAEKAGEVLKALEREMSTVEGELIQLDREDAHRATYGPPGSFMPILPGMAPVVPLTVPPAQTNNSGGGGPFNFRWRRGERGGTTNAQANVAAAQAQQQQQQQSQDPRSFGRFFRRNNPAPPPPQSAMNVPPPLPLLSLDSSTPPLNGSTPNSSSSNGGTTPFDSATDLIPSQVHLQPPSSNPAERFAAQQQFAQAHQAQALWAQAQARSSSNPSASPAGVIGGRRRAGSLNSVAAGQHQNIMMGYSGTSGRGGGSNSNSSSPSLMNSQIHASGAQSARTSFDEPHSYSQPFRSNSPFLVGNSPGSGGPEKEPPTAVTTNSPLGLGNVLRSARSRSDSTLGGDSTKGSIESSSTGGKTESGSAGGSNGGKGKNWTRLGSWSQVVGKGTKKGNQPVAETVEEADTAAYTTTQPRFNESPSPVSTTIEGNLSKDQVEPVQVPKTYQSIQASLHAPVYRAVTEKPFKYDTMTDVQAAVLSLLPRLASSPAPNDTPTEIQQAQDILVRAKTGTGKTLAFLIPALEGRLKSLESFLAEFKKENPEASTSEAKKALAEYAKKTVGALILSPTRELATQIANEAVALTTHLPQFGVRLLVGGASRTGQLREWMRSPSNDIVVATPGRCVDLLQSEPSVRKVIANSRMLILDEADTLLDMGFSDDIATVVRHVPDNDNRQTFLFSATVSKQIREVARKSLKKDHTYIDTVPADEVDTHLHIPQYHTILPSASDQLVHILRLLAHDQLIHAREAAKNGGVGAGKAVIFLPTTRLTQLFSQILSSMRNHLPWGRDTLVVEIHSKKSQDQRTRASDLFRRANSGYSVLVTSDVSARGVDYPGVTRVIQVGIPGSRDLYIHRVGRTGRAGKAGRGDLVLLPWESGFVSWQLNDIPLKPCTVGETQRQVAELAAEWDANPAEFAPPPPPSPSSSSRGRRDRSSLRPMTLSKTLSPRLETLPESLTTNVLPALDTLSVRETFASLLGYYLGKAHELRTTKDVVLTGLKKWSTEAGGLEEEPYVSPEFLKKLGMNDGRTKHRGKPRREFGGDRGGDREQAWGGRGKISSRGGGGGGFRERSPYDGGRSSYGGDRGGRDFDGDRRGSYGGERRGSYGGGDRRGGERRSRY